MRMEVGTGKRSSVWTKENEIEYKPDTQGQRARYRPGQQFNKKLLKLTFKAGRTNIHLWYAFQNGSKCNSIRIRSRTAKEQKTLKQRLISKIEISAPFARTVMKLGQRDRTFTSCAIDAPSQRLTNGIFTSMRYFPAFVWSFTSTYNQDRPSASACSLSQHRNNAIAPGINPQSCPAAESTLSTLQSFRLVGHAGFLPVVAVVGSSVEHAVVLEGD